MAKKLSRKDLKVQEDEFISTMVRLVDYVQIHRNIIIQAVVIVAVVVIIIFAYVSYRGSFESNAAIAQSRATMMYDDALNSFIQYDQNVADASKGQQRKDRFINIAEEFKKIYQEYSGSGIAAEALFYEANSYFYAEDYDHAMASYQQIVSDYADSPYSLPALMGVAYCKEQEDDRTVISTYNQILEKADNEQMKVDAYLGIARNEELLGNKDKALEMYEKIVNDYPSDSYGVDQAIARIDAIKLGKPIPGITSETAMEPVESISRSLSVGGVPETDDGGDISQED